MECLRPVPPSHISTKAKARHLIQANPRSLFLPLLPYNRAQNPKWLEHWGTTR